MFAVKDTRFTQPKRCAKHSEWLPCEECDELHRAREILHKAIVPPAPLSKERRT